MPLLSAVLVVSLPWLCLAYPSGAPLDVCKTLHPGKPHGNLTQTGNGGFVIATDLPLAKNGGFEYEPGQEYTVVLMGKNHTFRGWVIQARDPASEDSLLGQFLLHDPKYQHHLLCQGTQSTVTHNNTKRVDFQGQMFSWKAPTNSSSKTVELYYTVVEKKKIYYTSLHGSENSVPLDIKNQTKIEPANTALIFSIPKGCEQENCTVFVEIKNNSDPKLLTFHLEGESASWVAVGFSKTDNMPSADVFACNVNPDNNMIQALDTFNFGYHNRPDVDQSDITLLSGSFIDGRINCSFTRTVAGLNSSEDYNLNDEYYVMYGRRITGHPTLGHLFFHGHPVPSISDSKVNPYKDTGNPSADTFSKVQKYLELSHGIMMILAWPLLASTGIFIAAFMRPVLPKGKWFQAHRALMLASLFIAAAAFVIIFVSQMRNSPPGLIHMGRGRIERTAHFTIGIAVMFLQILTPIIAIFRCEPGTKYRWIFNRLHGNLVGMTAEVLAYANVGIGLAIYTHGYKVPNTNYAPIWLFIAYVVIIALFYAVLQAHSLLKPCCTHDHEQINPWQEDKDGEKEGLIGKKKMWKKEFYRRWGSFAFFLVLTVAVVIALIVLVAPF